MNFELYIEHNGNLTIPIILDGVMWTTERKGTAGKLNFSVIKDEKADFTEGDHIRLTVDGANLFYGFIFTKKRDKQHHISVTAYDQLRYLMNKDTYVYENKTASDVIKMLAEDFELQTGDITQTNYNITSRVEDNKMLFDMINNALDLELTNTKQMFVLYDDFGKITLKNLSEMKIDLLIDEETGENFDYQTSIDEQTYNKIKLTYENEETGKREIYITQHGENINNWGILQYFNTLNEGENGEAKAEALLNLYNAKTRKLKIVNAFGDTRVRAGSLIIVKLNLGDVDVQNYMMVEKCTHTFKNEEHFMDLILRGGEFVG